MAWLDGIAGVLLDIDGTLLVGDRAVPGAAEALARLDHAGIPWRLITNTTRRSCGQTALALRTAGIPVAIAAVLQPAALARKRILDSGRLRAALLVPSAAAADLVGVEVDEHAPDWVVLGDLGRGFTFDVLDRAFGWLHRGAALLALHKNRYWSPDEGVLALDAGAFVAALEYAAGVTAEVVGKPSPSFFRLALEHLGLPPEQVLVVGDDATNDAGGGAAAGCRTALVRTGKFGGLEGDEATFRPDMILDSVANLDPGR